MAPLGCRYTLIVEDVPRLDHVGDDVRVEEEECHFGFRGDSLGLPRSWRT